MKSKTAFVIPFAAVGAVVAAAIAAANGCITIERKVERHEATAAQVERLEGKVDRISTRVQEIAVDVARIAAQADQRVVVSKEVR